MSGLIVTMKPLKRFVFSSSTVCVCVCACVWTKVCFNSIRSFEEARLDSVKARRQQRKEATGSIRVSAAPGTTGNLLEFEMPPGNTGNILEFNWCSRKIGVISNNNKLVGWHSGERWSSSAHAHLQTFQTSYAHLILCGLSCHCTCNINQAWST